MNIPKHYCPLPFHHIAVRPNGRVYPCCYFRWEETPDDYTLDYPDLFMSHPFQNKIREDLRQDKPVAGCSKCYEDEELTGKSMRLRYLQDGASELGISGDTTVPPDEPSLTYIDLALSNVCNNKCRMCNHELSTSWYADAKAMGETIPKGLIKHGDPLSLYDYSKLKFIKLIGGEPLMEQEKFIYVLKQCDLKDLRVLITTNTTMKPNAELESLLDQCKKVFWNLSVDAYGPLNDFLRKNSKWEEVKENIDWYLTKYKKNVGIHSVVSIYNVNCFFELNKYVLEKYPDATVSYMAADGPYWITPNNLPEDAKVKIKHLLEEENAKYPIPNVNVVIDKMMQKGQFPEFLYADKKINILRKEHWKTLNTELYDIIKDDYEYFYDGLNVDNPGFPEKWESWDDPKFVERWIRKK